MTISNSTLSKYPYLADVFKYLDIVTEENGTSIDWIEDKSNNGLKIIKRGGQITIYASEKAYFIRSIGLVKENSDKESFEISENARFKTNGAMIDCSRNGVLNINTVKKITLQFALMGNNTLMLYTEDTYEIDNNPYFGYMRGRYTHEELSLLSEYAESLGVELVPCIQTLAHLQSALRWWTYHDIIDANDILLADEEKTYALIEEMLKACRKSFKSSRINIGMDEASFIGRGAYKNKHGDVPAFDIMCRHLSKVIGLCKKYGFRPMMWSDMFFHIVNGGYNSADIPESELKKVPPDVDLVYWDYYNSEKYVYDANIKKHKKFNNPVCFAGGTWKWVGYAPSLFYSMKVSRLALKSCIENGIENVFTTAWGDNGNDASVFSVLPAYQLFAEYNFNPDITDEELSRRLMTCTKADLNSFYKLDLPDFPCEDHGRADANPSKYLMFQDIMAGVFDKHVKPGFGKYYEETAKVLEQASNNNSEYKYVFDTLSKLCVLLALKSEVGIGLKEAYDSKNTAVLSDIANKTLPEIAKAAEAFKDAMETQWFIENKSFGFEVQDIRIGAVITRAKSASRRIKAYLNGEIDRIEELEAERLYFDCRTEELPYLTTTCNQWHLIASACLI